MEGEIMENIIIQISNLLIQTVMLTYFITGLAKCVDRTDYSKKQILIIALILFIISAICSIFKESFSAINTIVITITFYCISYFILKVKPVKSLLITFSTVITQGITELIGVFLLMLIMDINFQDILSSRITSLVVVTLQAILNIVIIKIIELLIDRKGDLRTIFKEITAKQIGMFTILLAAYTLPQLLLLNINGYSYPIPLLIINSLQFVGITLFLFIYLKRDVELEKTQNDLLTSELHNKTMVGMVDGVRTLKHDYNNIMQALNRICINKTI